MDYNVIYTIKRNSVCVFVCFNSFQTARGTSIKLETIDDHSMVSVIRGFVTVHDDVIIKNNFLEFALFDRR